MPNISELTDSGSSVQGDIIRKGLTAWEVGSNNLGDLKDATISSVAGDEVLSYNQSANKWVNSNLATLIASNSVDISLLSNVVEDTTPQLGGNLDANEKEITKANRLVIEATTGHEKSSLVISNGSLTEPRSAHEIYILKDQTTTGSSQANLTTGGAVLWIGGDTTGTNSIVIPLNGVVFYELDLIGIDVSDPTKHAVWRQKGAFTRSSTAVTQSGATVTDEVISQTGSWAWDFNVRTTTASTSSISVYVDGGTASQVIRWTGCLRVTKAV